MTKIYSIVLACSLFFVGCQVEEASGWIEDYSGQGRKIAEDAVVLLNKHFVFAQIAFVIDTYAALDDDEKIFYRKGVFRDYMIGEAADRWILTQNMDDYYVIPDSGSLTEDGAVWTVLRVRNDDPAKPVYDTCIITNTAGIYLMEMFDFEYYDRYSDMRVGECSLYLRPSYEESEYIPEFKSSGNGNYTVKSERGEIDVQWELHGGRTSLGSWTSFLRAEIEILSSLKGASKPDHTEVTIVDHDYKSIIFNGIWQY